MQRHALALLFSLLALGLAGVAAASLVGAHGGGRVVVGVAALALAGWLGSLALASIRRHR